MDNALQTALTPPLTIKAGDRLQFGQLYGSSFGLVIGAAARKHQGIVLVVTPDTPSASRLEEEFQSYNGGDDAIPVLSFPDWETPPYDTFSPTRTPSPNAWPPCTACHSSRPAS